MIRKRMKYATFIDRYFFDSIAQNGHVIITQSTDTTDTTILTIEWRINVCRAECTTDTDFHYHYINLNFFLGFKKKEA